MLEESAKSDVSSPICIPNKTILCLVYKSFATHQIYNISYIRHLYNKSSICNTQTLHLTSDTVTDKSPICKPKVMLEGSVKSDVILTLPSNITFGDVTQIEEDFV